MSDTGAETNESNTDGTETVEAVTGKETSGDTSAAGDDFKPITSQRELEQALKVRLDRERSKFKDYADLKDKATQFDALVEASKSREELAVERAETAEREAAMLKAEKQIEGWKKDVAKVTGVPVEALRGATLEELEDHAATLKPLLPEPRKPGSVPGEGRTVQAGTGDRRERFAKIIQGT